VSVLDEGIVRVAVEPALTGLGRGDHGMAAGARVGAGVPVRRIITAQRDAAILAGAKMHPLIAGLDALLADTPLGVLDGGDGG